MLDYIRNRFATATLKARYQRLVHERLLELTESGSHAVHEDPGHWQPVGSEGRGLSIEEASDLRSRAREFVRDNPHARQILRLMEAYVDGPELNVAARLVPSTHEARMALKSMHESVAFRSAKVASEVMTDFSSQIDAQGEFDPKANATFAERKATLAEHADADAQRLLDQANNWWKQFIERNHHHYSFREHARRTWRDGESFLRIFHEQHGPPSVRFIDPEWIGPTREAPDSQGIVTEPHDAESPLAYLRIDPATGDLAEAMPAGDIMHTRIGVDSNEKRGVSLFAPLLDTLDQFQRWLQTELLARKLQASIVLWRRVQGSPAEALRMSEATATGDTACGGRRERFQPGTILTTNQSTDVQFLQPKTNFTDAVPLGRMLLLSVAAGAGLPEFMLTSDASNNNYASTMVAEGPAVKMFQSEQQFFSQEWSCLWRTVMRAGIAQGHLPADLFERIEPGWTFPVVVNRDRTKERMTDARLVQTRVLSRAEVARRDGVDPSVMRCEIAEEG
jgi:hypothetical protein